MFKMNFIQAFILLFAVKSCRGHTIEKVPDYDIYEKPAGRPLLVNASLNLRNIIGISETEQTISLEVTLRLFWKDERVKLIVDKTQPAPPHDSTHSNLAYLVQCGDRINQFWLPDLFVDQAIQTRSPKYKMPTESLKVYEDSTIRFSRRFNFDVACHMNFKMYPVDQQSCTIRFESFGYTDEEIKLMWLEEWSMDINEDIDLPKFISHMHANKEYKTDYYKQAYPGLELQIHLIRKIDYHIVQTFLPSIIYVCIAYFVLLIPPDCLVVRTGMGMFTMLTMTTLTKGVKDEVPEVSYLTYMDLWLFTCLVFIFSFIVIIVTTAVLIKKGKEVLSQKIEFWAMLLYPIIFLVLNVIYWTILLTTYNGPM